MADDEKDEAPEEDTSTNKDRESAQAARSLDKLTDHVEEEQTLDTSKAKNAMAALAAAQQASREEQRRRERALAAVKISQEDVGIIATEFEVDKKKAELRLREHDGNVVAALESFL